MMKEVASFIRSGTPSPHWPAISSDQECLRRWAINNHQEEEEEEVGLTEQNLDSEDVDGPFVCGAAERVSSNLNARCDFIIKNVYQWQEINIQENTECCGGSAIILCKTTSLFIAFILTYYLAAMT